MVNTMRQTPIQTSETPVLSNVLSTVPLATLFHGFDVLDTLSIASQNYRRVISGEVSSAGSSAMRSASDSIEMQRSLQSHGIFDSSTLFNRFLRTLG